MNRDPLRNPAIAEVATQREHASILVELTRQIRAADAVQQEAAYGARDRPRLLRQLFLALKAMGVHGEDVTQICSEVMRS